MMLFKGLGQRCNIQRKGTPFQESFFVEKSGVGQKMDSNKEKLLEALKGYREKSLIYKFNGFWPVADALDRWISANWI